MLHAKLILVDQSLHSSVLPILTLDPSFEFEIGWLHTSPSDIQAFQDWNRAIIADCISYSDATKDKSKLPSKLTQHFVRLLEPLLITYFYGTGCISPYFLKCSSGAIARHSFTIPLFSIAALAFGLLGCAKKSTNVERGIANNELYIGIGTEPSALDPHLTTGLTEYSVMLALFEGLTTLHPKQCKLKLVSPKNGLFQKIADAILLK
jgi:hypothetical protein